VIPRRTGLVAGAVLLVLAAVQGLDVHPDVAGRPVDPLAVVVAAGSAALAVVDLALLPAAWRGGRRSATGSAVVLLLGILPSLPAFLLPAGVVPPDGVLAATVGALLHASATTLVLLERSSRLLVVAAGLAAVACFAGGVALLAAVLPEALDRVGQTAVAVAMAFSFHPLTGVLRRTVGRSLYGGRVTPSSTAAEIGKRLGSGGGVVTEALEEARAALRLPALDLVSLPAGAAPHPASVDVPAAGDPGLRLRAGLPTGRTRLRRDERQALELVAVPIALLVGQTRLTAEVTAARAAAARAREDERTALQADLHDGLGPLLTGAGLRVGAARNLVPVDAVAADAHLAAVAADIRVATDEVRRVVHRMRPQELDELGLWAALRHRAGRAGATIALPTHPPDLSAAVEVAVYRIVAESLANVERHAPGAPAAVLVSRAAGTLHVEVTNAGPERVRPPDGVGLTSVRNRAAELGGHAEAGPVPGGWRVLVDLPSARDAGGSADDDGELPGGDELADHR
jgi:signal transduction histidine kinase